ncbi:possible tyrosine transporter P-protein [Seinonella peptonophila]|uniref:Possible tyrosine transporter P-protein n=1 Tax=Seinonella peptonophila TaxID=112248 RepID=A0A1M4Y5E9_9BACL|nr:ArsB/NhaD family transporter [Seinonella peptonophila]SHF00803.1 possible tyrosine transporter P-protein [Seinonella peptonophila]
MSGTYLATGVFLFVYAFIITEKLNRAVIAILGAMIMVLLGILNVEKVFTHYIEWNTLALLIGMMILVTITQSTGLFQWIAIKAAKAVNGNPVQLLIMLSLLTAIGSALLDNVTTILLMAPITFSITRILQVNPVPYLIAEIIASNIGGTATLIGDPPNIMIGSSNPHLTFNAFLYHLGPVALITLLIALAMLYFIYRKQLNVSVENQQKLAQINEEKVLKNHPLIKKSLFILCLTILGFLTHSWLSIEPSVIAITGAAILMLIGLTERQIETAFASVEWGTIFFFAGLFALVGGLQEVGLIKYIAHQILAYTAGDLSLAAIWILWISGIASATIDNIPFVATMIPLIKEMGSSLGLVAHAPELQTMWWSLALGACLGGNGTILGASANVIMVGLAAKEGKKIHYLEFLKVGVPITLMSLLIAHLYIVLRYL